MTKREAMRLTMQNDNLRSLGLSPEECDQLRRISLTLRHWGERCCNEDIEMRDDGSAWWRPQPFSSDKPKQYRIPNREAGALRRLDAIFATRKRTLTYYHQTDPRGAALYVVPLVRLRHYGKTKADLGRCYSQVGIVVY